MSFVTIGIFVVVTCGVAGAAYWFGRKQVATAPASAAHEEASSDRTQAYAERFGLVKQWQEVLGTFHAQLVKLYSVEEMVTTLISALQHEFTNLHVLIALGPIRDILLQSLTPNDTKFVELNSDSCILAQPYLEGDLTTELAQELYSIAKKHRSASKRWMMVRDVQPALQSRLASRYHLAGPAMLIPITCGDLLCGIVLLSGPQLAKAMDLLQDNARFAVMASDSMASWVRSMAPQLLAGTAADPIATTPIMAMASLNLLEKSAMLVQTREEDREILSELASYSRSILTPSAEISLLAMQTCCSLRKICQADFAMFLRPASDEPASGYAAEAIEMNGWSWSRYQGYKGENDHCPVEDKDLNRWPDAFVARVIHEGQMVESRLENDTKVAAPTLAEMDLKSVVAMPILVRNKCIAILVVGRTLMGGISDLSQMVALSVASLAGISLANLYLISQEYKMQEKVQNYWKMTSTVTAQSLEVLKGIINKRSMLTMTNPEEVARVAEAVAHQMRLTPKEISLIRLSALLCDLGTVMIPLTLLRKEGGLTGEELQIVQNHPKVSVELLGKLDILSGTLPVVLHHHEHFDGNGYPESLSQDKIPLEARILAVADTYVNLQLKRPYRAAFTQEEALKLIQQEAGKQFDPTVVRALLRMVAAESASENAA